MEKLDLEKSTVKPRATLKQCVNTKWVGDTGKTKMVDLDEKGRLIYEFV